MPKISTFETNHMTDAVFYILLALLTPRHGYGVMKYVEGLTDGKVKISSATLYTLLKKLQQEGLIEPCADNSTDKKIEYTVTSQGLSIVKAEIDRHIGMAQHGCDALEEKANKEFENIGSNPV